MFTVLLFLVFVHGLNGLSCVDSIHSFRVPRKNFEWNTFTSDTIEANFQSQSGYDNSVCHVTIIVEYNIQENDYVNITYGDPASDTCDYIEFGTTFTLENDQQSMVSYIDYVCSSHDFCEHTFVNQWVKRLLGTDNNSLHTTITYLLSNSSESTRCYWKNPTSDCASHMCFALYDELKNIPLNNGSCLENRSLGSTYIYVKIKQIESVHSLPIEFEYKCKKNKFTQELSYDFADHQRFDDSIHSLSCSHQNFTSASTNLRSTNFSFTLIELDKEIKSFLDNINRCDIYMEADYRQHDGHVTINYDEPKISIQKHMTFDMILTVENSIPSIWSRMFYTCLPPHSCDRKLVNKWIQWLINIKNQTLQLESKLSSESTIQSHKCDIWGHAIDDSIDVCFAYTYKRIQNMNIDNVNTIDVLSKTTNNKNRRMETDSPHFTCSRFHDNKNQVFQYILDEILQQCAPKHSLKSTQLISNSISEHPLFNQNGQLTGIKSVTVNDQMKLNRIRQSSTTTTTMETSTDPIFF